MTLLTRSLIMLTALLLNSTASDIGGCDNVLCLVYTPYDRDSPTTRNVFFAAAKVNDVSPDEVSFRGCGQLLTDISPAANSFGVIALVATPANDGIIQLVDQVGAFSLTSITVGAGRNILVRHPVHAQPRIQVQTGCGWVASFLPLECRQQIR